MGHRSVVGFIFIGNMTKYVEGPEGSTPLIRRRGTWWDIEVVFKNRK
jgi:hypothetical protein